LCLEQLEPRLVLATFLVTDSGDTAGAANDVTLRYAITQANALGGTNTILFSSAVTKIDLASALPSIIGNLTIAGPGPSELTIDRSASAGTDFGILSLQANNVLIEGVTLSGGNAPNDGGAIYNDGSTLTVNNATIENNTAPEGYGGGIYNYAGTLTVSHSTIENNTAPDGWGGGIFCQSYNATTISDTLLAGNSAADGGGIANQEYSENTSAVTLARVTLYNNTATNEGGGIFNLSDYYYASASLSATDCTIYDNQAEYAAGIYDLNAYSYDNAAWVSATNCTVYGNISSSGGAGIEVDGGDAYATLENTIVAGNTEDGTPLDFNGELSDQGHNLVQAPGSTSFTASGDVTGVSPGVLTYANNGGFTPTLALASNSPAIAAGDPSVLSTLTVDQRGFARSSDGIHVDIGAYEYGSTGTAPSFTSTTSTTFATGTLDGFAVAASGAPAPLVTESGTLPAGVWFDSTTDTLVGTPVAGTTGTYGLTFSAENGGTPVTQSFTLTVFDGTSIAISPLPGTTTYGQSVTLTATVTSVSGVTPSGTVTFRDDGTMLGASPVTLNDSGVATLVLPTLTAGTHAITASYSGYSGGGNNFAASATTPGPNSIIATVAGNGSDGYGGDGSAATATSLQSPFGVAVDAAGDIFIADTFNNRIREVVKATGNIITVAGTNFAGFNGDGIAATAASLDQPNGVAVDAAGDIFIADSGNYRVREVVKATGDIITIAGSGGAGYNGDGIAAVGAELDYPRGVAVDSAGDVFIADSYNGRVREVSGGIITTVAGGGSNAGNDGFGDGGAATAASLSYPTGVAVDASGNLFIADTGNERIREVSGGIITTVAGGGSDTVRLGDGGPATAAYLSQPQGVAVDAAGDIFIADSSDYRVREVIAATGNIVTVAGTGDSDYTYNGDGIPAGTANLWYPTGVAVDAAGNLFIADQDGQRIREVASGGLLTTVAPAALTVTANNASIAYGATIPTLSGTVSGVVSGDGITASYATTATSESTPGNYAITATLADPDHKLANYVVINTPGTLTIDGVIASISPGTSLFPSGYITNSGTFALQGYAVPHDTIDIKQGTTILGGATAASNGAWSFVVFEPAGAYTFSEVDSNPTINYDDTESLAVTVDETAPTVTLNSLTSPTTNNQPTLSGSRSTATVDQPLVLQTSLYSGSSVNPANLLGTTFTEYAPKNESSYTTMPTTTLSDGTYTAVVSQTDVAGNTGFSQAVTFTVDTNIPAAPTIVEPATAVVTAANSYTIQGTAQANSLVSVYTNSGGTLVTSEQLSGGATSFSLPVPLASNAASTFTVTATDALGDASPAATVPTITQGAATASLASTNLSATYGQDEIFTATVSGSVNTPSGTVSLYDGSTLLVSDVSLTAGTPGTATATFDSSTFAEPLSGGSHLLTVVYSGDGNFAPARSAAIDELIAKADATVNVSGYSGVYDGQPHGASGTATGVLNEDLSSLLDLGATFTDVPGGTADWSFAGNADYNATSGTAAITITAADATVNVSGYSGVYDGNPHGASGTATGIGNVDLTSDLNLGATFTNVPGGAAYWTFNAGSDYNTASGSVSVIINPVAAITTTTLVASPGSLAYGQSETLTAKVSAASGTPLGSVTFLEGTTALGTEPLIDGTATLPAFEPSIGVHHYTASYGGDSGVFAPSTAGVGPGSIITTVAGNRYYYGYGGDGGPASTAELNVPFGVAMDAAGDLFIADTYNNVVREVNALSGVITTVAGNGTAGYSGDTGPATAAELDNPTDVALNAAGNLLFIADPGNSVVREVNLSSGVISTVAGDGTQGYNGNGDGQATTVELSGASAVAVDTSGDLFIADTDNSVVREVNLSGGTITTVAGNGVYGYSGDNGPATAAELGYPEDVALDAAGDLFIADSGSNVVREVSAGGTISTVAGNGTAGYSGDNGPAVAAELSNPEGVKVNAAGDLFIADVGNNVVREVDLHTGFITTLAGNGTAGYSGDGGPASAAELNYPSGFAVDASGDILFADSYNSVIREIANGAYVTVAPDPTTTTLGALPASITYGLPETLTATVASSYGTPTGSVTFMDGTTTLGTEPLSGGAATLPSFTPSAGVHEFRAIYSGAGHYAPSTTAVGPNSIVTTVAGNGIPGYSGDGNPATAAELQMPWGMAVDASGDLFIADPVSDVVREVVKATGNIITVAGDGIDGYSGDGSQATAAELDLPTGLAVDATGHLFIADSGNSVVREVNLTSGVITTVAGNGIVGYNGDNIQATAAELAGPTGIAVDAAGDLFITSNELRLVPETRTKTILENGREVTVEYTVIVPVFENAIGDERIREVNLTSGLITTVAGNGTGGYSGDGGPATAAELDNALAVTVDSAGDLFIADYGNDVVREVNLANGLIHTVAGSYDNGGYFGDGGPATDAGLAGPAGVAVDAAGDLFIADHGNDVVREVNLASGLISTVVGDGNYGYSGDNGAASAAGLEYPVGIAVDAAGDLFISDSENSVVREVAGRDMAMTVAPAPLTITATSVSKGYGQANPTITGSAVSALAAADGIGVSYSTTATQYSPPGVYPVTATLTDPDDKLGNYAVTITPGTLTIAGVISSINPGASAAGGGFVTGSETFALQGFAVPHDVVDIEKGNTILGGVTVASNGAWSFVVLEPAGTYTFSAVDSNPTMHYDDTASLSVTVEAMTPAFSLLGPSAGTYFVGQGVTIAWTATGVDVAGPTKISLAYDADPTAFDAHEKWIEIDGVTAANGAGAYSWNTSGVAAGTYYLAGYMYDFSTETAVFSSIGSPIVIAAGSPPAFALNGPSAGTFSVGQSVTLQWTAAGVDVAGPTKISLGYDADPTAFDAHEKWIEIDGVTAANGAASYSWNTAGVTSGTYYLSGYMYDFSTHQAVFSQLGTPIVFTVGVTPPPTAFALNGPSAGTFTAGQTVTIQWTATSVDVSGPSKISLGYDQNATVDGNEHWIEVDKVTAANGTASYAWNTAGVASGTYYLGGYMYDFSTSKALYSFVGTSIVITGGVPTAFTVLGPSAGTFTAGTNVTIAWTATNVDTAGPSKISLGYDQDATIDGNEHWLEVDQVTAANGTGSYVWNTTGVAAGTYYLGGYIYDFSTSQAIFSSVATTITILSNAAH
jgi:hypothetical protein